MGKEQKLFLGRVRKNWETEFPFFKPVDLNEIPKLPKGCKFRCDDYASIRGVFYFVTFDFSQRRQGEFSVRITVSDSPVKSVLDPATDYQPTPTSIGSHSIAAFLGRQAFRWDLVDVDAKTNATLASFGAAPVTPPGYVSPNTWKPSSYALPFEQIADEAIRDVSDKLRRFVFPKLEIAVDE